MKRKPVYSNTVSFRVFERSFFDVVVAVVVVVVVVVVVEEFSLCAFCNY